MRTVPFDTHAFVKKLAAAGVAERQAEVRAEALAEIVVDQLATRQDLLALEPSLTLRFGAMPAASVAITAALVKLL